MGDRFAPRAAFAAFLGSLAAGFAWAQAPITLADHCVDPAAADHTACIRAWVDAGRTSSHKTLFAPAGVFRYSGAATIYSGMQLQCAGSSATIFRSVDALGAGVLLQAAAPVSDVRIQNCGFDLNGNMTEYVAAIDISPDVQSTQSTNIRVRGNRIFDSARPGQTSDLQRQYIVLLNCRDCRVEENHLSEGGRIKVGRPGRRLTIEANRVEHANDNAITVVDVGAGVSEDIVIRRNTVLSPVGIGIYFGADGDNQGSPTLTTTKVRVEQNRVEGNWDTACILGRLPAQAADIRILENTCVKTGATKSGTSGIVVKRTCNASIPAQRVWLERNQVFSTVSPALGAALDHGGISLSGIYHHVRVRHNTIRDIGARAMYFRFVKMTDTVVVQNTLVGGGFEILGDITGDVQTNTRTPTTSPIPEACKTP